MNENQAGSTRIDAWFLSIAALMSAALALGCSGSDGRGQEKSGKKKGIKPDTTVIVRTAAFSPDSKLLVVATGPGGKFPENSPQQRAMQLWDVETGKLLHTFWLDKAAIDVFFFDGGKKILTSDYGSITIFDVAKGARDGKYIRGGIPLAIMRDGKKLLVYTDDDGQRAIELWDPFTAKVLQKLPTKSQPNSSPAAVSPDGKWALVACSGQIIAQLWDLSRGEVQFSLVGLQKGDEPIYQLWDHKGKVKKTFAEADVLGHPVAFSPDSKTLVAAHINGREEPGREKFSLRLWEIETVKALRTLARFSEGIGLMTFSPDGKELVLFTEKHLRRLQFPDGKQLWSVPLSLDRISIFSPDATRLFLGGGVTYSSLKGNDVDTLRLEIWDAVHGKKLRNLTRERP
jgi:WD40 repeat protein